MICVRADIPKIIFAFLHFLMISEGAELTAPERVRNHVGAHPERKLPDLIFLRRVHQFFTGDFNLRTAAFAAQPFEKIKSRIPHLLQRKSRLLNHSRLVDVKF